MKDARPLPSTWSVPALAVSVVVGLLLGLAAGAATDRAVSTLLGPPGQFAVGITTAAIAAVAIGIASYRALSQGDGQRTT